MIPIIVGFSSSNRVPGFYGETVYGAGAISAGSIPLALLLVGTKGSGGSAVENQDVVDINSSTDADTYFGAGYELARMCYAALRVPGVKIKAAAVPEAGGAAAGAQVITIGGSWSTVGTLTYRVNGETIQYSPGSTESISSVCTALAAEFNRDSRRPYTAAATATQVILTAKSKGARSNQFLTFQDTSKNPSGLTSVISGVAWTANTAKTTSGPISFVVPTVANGFYYKCTTGGTTDATTQPTWPTTVGSTVVDGTVTWTCWGEIETGGATRWGGGSGTETLTTLLGLLANVPANRVAVAQNDSTNLAAWKTQLNTQAGPTVGILEHLVTAVSDSYAAAASLATTINSERIQLLWEINGETVPWEVSAFWAAYRCSVEQVDPAASYDDVLLTGVAPISQATDQPSNAVKQSAINNGITVIYSDVDGAKICRSVTTHTLSGSTPDYRTLDTSDAYVPDFVRVDVGLHWKTVYKVNNPRVADNPPGDQKAPPAGVAIPDTWNADVEAKLRRYEKGILASGNSPVAATVPPIIIDVDNNKPYSLYDPVAKRIMSVIPVVPAPANHQIGVSVRNVSSV